MRKGGRHYTNKKHLLDRLHAMTYYSKYKYHNLLYFSLFNFQVKNFHVKHSQAVLIQSVKI